MIKEAIILAGGLGTRLRDAVPDAPKSMALVAGHPFLVYVIRHLLSQGVERFIFSLGYKSEIIESFLANHYAYLNYVTVIETKPLGTGGAIRLALEHAKDRDVLVMNGDTLFSVSIDAMYDTHIAEQADCTVALKPLSNFDRYGSVEIDNDHRIKKFIEKKTTERGLINGGVYIVNRLHFLKYSFPEVFSFEKEFLESYVDSAKIAGIIQDKYFIDIGIPDDYEKADRELPHPELDISMIDHSWTLFLDRDGVINENKDGSYVFNRGEFTFIPGSLEALSMLKYAFGKIIIVTNQRGVGKGLMDIQALNDVHQHMIDEIVKGGGRIDDLFYCTHANDKHPERKPNPGMLLEAVRMYPEIEFSKSIMVGDKYSDMELGRNVGAFTVMIKSSQSGDYEGHPDVDLRFDSLLKFSQYLDRRS